MDETQISEEMIDRKILMKHNLLVQAKYNLSLVQNRIFELLLYHFQKEKDGILSCEISRDELKKYIGKEKDKTIKGMSDILESLRKKEILVAERIEGKEKYKWHRYGLINGSTYNEETDTFIVKATEEIYVLIQNYYDKKEGHTPINLIIKLGMNNYYAQRLYDLIRVWSGTKKVVTYKIEDLKDLLQLNDKYPMYADFKKRVLLPAVKELNDTGYFEIELEENRMSRKVVSVDFIVKDLDKRKYFSTPMLLENKSNVNQSPPRDVVKIELPPETKKEQEQSSKNSDFYVPNKKLFTVKTLDRFKQDFGDYDFKDKIHKSKLQEAIVITLEKDDSEKIYDKAYEYFKTTLIDKMSKQSNANENNKQKTKKEKTQVVTKFHNVNTTFNKYSPDELEKMLLQSQKGKFDCDKKEDSKAKKKEKDDAFLQQKFNIEV